MPKTEGSMRDITGVPNVVFLNIGALIFWICPSTRLRMVSHSKLLMAVSLPNGWSNHFVLRISCFEIPVYPDQVLYSALILM